MWFSPQYGEMHLVQQGDGTVVGRYEKEERVGRIQGSVVGDIMRFEWSEKREIVIGHPSKHKGHGYFRIAKDAQEDTWKLMGEWGLDDDETGGGPWNAVKSKNRKPDIEGDGASTPSGGGSSGSEQPASEGSAGDKADDATKGDDLGDL